MGQQLLNDTSMLRIISFVLAASFVAVVADAKPATAPALQTLYGFKGRTHHDGRGPWRAPFVDANGTLFGTTQYGGQRCTEPKGCGTVFALEPSASGYTERIVHTFVGSDGQFPIGAPVADRAGTLYGTTMLGGTSHAGVAYKIERDGSRFKYTTLYTFTGGAEGGRPQGELLMGKGGVLYGTTYFGGGGSGPGRGVVFRLVPRGSGYAESVIHSFAGGLDGANPADGLTAGPNGTMFGVTEGDGTTRQWGSVFELVPSSGGYTERVLYSFSGVDPSGPVAIDANGVLYGTYAETPNSALYTLTPNGSSYTYNIAFAFDPLQQTDPRGSLVLDSAGNIYGTQDLGKEFKTCNDGCGAAYELKRGASSYTFVNLHTFSGGSDGGNPIGGLVRTAKRTLLGTTANGGPGGCRHLGCGSVFRLDL